MFKCISVCVVGVGVQDKTLSLLCERLVLILKVSTCQNKKGAEKAALHTPSEVPKSSLIDVGA